jgi:hypothetical protein
MDLCAFYPINQVLNSQIEGEDHADSRRQIKRRKVGGIETR